LLIVYETVGSVIILFHNSYHRLLESTTYPTHKRHVRREHKCYDISIINGTRSASECNLPKEANLSRFVRVPVYLYPLLEAGRNSPCSRGSILVLVDMLVVVVVGQFKVIISTCQYYVVCTFCKIGNSSFTVVIKLFDH
jgi:hypothetical protein